MDPIRPAIVKAHEDLATLAERIDARELKSRRMSVEAARQQGEDLLKAKTLCGHGRWLKWLQENVKNVGERQARHYMELAKSEVTSDLAEEWKKWQRIQGNTAADEDRDKATVTGHQNDAGSQDESDEPHERERGRPMIHPQWVRDECERIVREGPFPNFKFPDEEGYEPQSTRQALPVVGQSGESSIPPFHKARSKTQQKEYITLKKWGKMTDRQRKAALAIDNTKARFNNQGDAEGIEWALWSWNPVTGCLHNCPYCYARDIANRFYEQKFEPSLVPERLCAPRYHLFPEKDAKDWMGHKNVFVCSMADLFGKWVPSEWIEAVLKEVRAAPQWNFLFLTKFPNRMTEFIFPDNAWVGTTVDCQKRVANAEKAFAKIKAGVKWLSCEPLIEPLSFKSLEVFNWLVIGGASKSTQTPEWRPPLRWVVDLEERAVKAGVPFYEKPNLGAREHRIRQYPGDKPYSEEMVKAPEELRYLPSQM